MLHLVEDAEERLLRKLRTFSPPLLPNDRESITDSCRAFQDRLRELRIDAKEIERRRLKILHQAYDAITANKIDIELIFEEVENPPPAGQQPPSLAEPDSFSFGRALIETKQRAELQVLFEKEVERLRNAARTADLPKSTPSLASSPDEHPCKRGSEVVTFLQKCNQLSAARVRKKHIWLLIGHSKGRQFEYWQACNEEKATAEDKINFSRVLRMKPEDFLAALRKKRLLPSD